LNCAEKDCVHDFSVVNLATGQSSTMAPLGALYVVAAAEEAGYSVAFRDYALEDGSGLFSLGRITWFPAAADSPVLARGRTADLAEVEELIRGKVDLFPRFYHFGDGRIEENIALGRKLNLNLPDIRIGNLSESRVCS